jgi:hypothetical protein
MRLKRTVVFITASLALLSFGLAAAPSEADIARLGKDLTPLGAERAGNASGRIPAWEGGFSGPRPTAGTERHPESYPQFTNDEVLYTITAANMAQHLEQLTPGQQALLRKFPDTYSMPVYPTRRSGVAPDFVYEATLANARNARLANGGESLLGAVTGIPFPLPSSGKEVMWNHKLRYRGESVRRYNTQLAVQSNGLFTPYKLREDVRFEFSRRGMTPDALNNVGIYFLQFTVAPARQAGNVLLVHETMDQVSEPRRAWLYNPGQRRVRRAPNVAYDNPGTGADGLRTNDQLDSFNGATDRYSWNLVGKREMILPYNAYKLADNRLRYDDIAHARHMNPALTRYELRRVWVVDSELNSGTTHLYKRRTFYVDEDTWTILAVDVYDRRDQLWRVQEAHSAVVPWEQAIAPSAGTVYDLQANRYLIMDLANEEPLAESMTFPENHFTTGNITRMATR